MHIVYTEGARESDINSGMTTKSGAEVSLQNCITNGNHVQILPNVESE